MGTSEPASHALVAPKTVPPVDNMHDQEGGTNLVVGLQCALKLCCQTGRHKPLHAPDSHWSQGTGHRAQAILPRSNATNHRKRARTGRQRNATHMRSKRSKQPREALRSSRYN